MNCEACLVLAFPPTSCSTKSTQAKSAPQETSVTKKKGVDLAGLLENERRKSSKCVLPLILFIFVAVNGLKVSVIVWATNSRSLHMILEASSRVFTACTYSH